MLMAFYDIYMGYIIFFATVQGITRDGRSVPTKQFSSGISTAGGGGDPTSRIHQSAATGAATQGMMQKAINAILKDKHRHVAGFHTHLNRTHLSPKQQ